MTKTQFHQDQGILPEVFLRVKLLKKALLRALLNSFTQLGYPWPETENQNEKKT